MFGRSLFPLASLATSGLLFAAPLLRGDNPGDSALRAPSRQAPYPANPGTQVTGAPGTHYRAGALHSWLLGRHYRRTWATPVEVPVLDLATYSGGLKVKKRGGGLQTLSVTFEAADGRLFKFRGIDKDPVK